MTDAHPQRWLDVLVGLNRQLIYARACLAVREAPLALEWTSVYPTRNSSGALDALRSDLRKQRAQELTKRQQLYNKYRQIGAAIQPCMPLMVPALQSLYNSRPDEVYMDYYTPYGSVHSARTAKLMRDTVMEFMNKK